MRRLAKAVVVAALSGACARMGPAPESSAPPREPAVAIERPSQRVEAEPREAETPRVERDRDGEESARKLVSPGLLRVGLATDRQEVELPCCGDKLVLKAGDRFINAASPIHITPAAEVVEPGFYRLQVAALKDEEQAQSLALRLRRSLAAPADVVFDAGSDLYRVRVGRYSTREAADEVVGWLGRQGLAEAWIVSEQALLRESAFRLSYGEHSVRLAGRWLAIRGDGEEGVRFEESRYRGRLLIFLNNRGSLNVINEVLLEDYLRGVVPREMGPEIYDNLEALKAQTVAARTYTLKNLGEFLDEGYDICATPRCQVYGGMGSEHPLSDRAIAETAGEVLWFGTDLVDALYSSSCGGHTEDVQVIFPQKTVPYLKGVACLEAGAERVAGNPVHETEFASAVMRRLFPPKGLQTEPEVLAARLEHLALAAGLPLPDDRLDSLDRREVQRFLASVFDLALDLQQVAAPEDPGDQLEIEPPGWAERDLRLAAYLRQNGLLAGNIVEPLGAAEIEETMYRLAVSLRVIRQVEGRYQGIDSGELRLKAGRETLSYHLADRLATFRWSDDRLLAEPLQLLAGDRVTLYLNDRRVLAVVQASGGQRFSFSGPPNGDSWTRFRSDGRLAELVNASYPGLGFRGLTVLSRGVSGRVGRLEIEGDNGNRVEIEGLAIRWTLDLPDTLFSAQRVTSKDRQAGWLFNGRGWGHGVGMCQVGAYGMSLRGHTYSDILHYYYTGIEIAKIGVSEGGTEAASLR